MYQRGLYKYASRVYKRNPYHENKISSKQCVLIFHPSAAGKDKWKK